MRNGIFKELLIMVKYSCGSCRMTSDEKDIIVRLGIDAGIIVSHQSGYFVPDILTASTKNPEKIEQILLEYTEKTI